MPISVEYVINDSDDASVKLSSSYGKLTVYFLDSKVCIIMEEDKDKFLDELEELIRKFAIKKEKG